MLSLVAFLWPRQPGPDTDTIPLQHTQTSRPIWPQESVYVKNTSRNLKKRNQHKHNNLFWWPQEGVGPRKIYKEAHTSCTNHCRQLQIITPVFPLNIKATTLRVFNARGGESRNLAAHFPLLQSEEPHSWLCFNGSKIVAIIFSLDRGDHHKSSAQTHSRTTNLNLFYFLYPLQPPSSTIETIPAVYYQGWFKRFKISSSFLKILLIRLWIYKQQISLPELTWAACKHFSKEFKIIVRRLYNEVHLMFQQIPVD